MLVNILVLRITGDRIELLVNGFDNGINYTDLILAIILIYIDKINFVLGVFGFVLVFH